MSTHRITMLSSNIKIISVIFLCVLVHGTHNLDYSDLEAMGAVACPERDRCEGYRHNLSYMDRSCECDFACLAYKDCCIDANRRRSSARTASPRNLTCMQYGVNNHSGVYVVSSCLNSWNGPVEVRQKCEGPPDFTDPMSAAPVTSVAQAVTYKNLFCAECNNANMDSLKTFQFKLACETPDELPEAQIMGDLYYNQQQASWGINRMDPRGNSNFVECEIIFDVPSYLNRSVRFCRANIVSTCASNWTRQEVRNHCEQYMSIVYDETRAYKNPHCAICNRRAVTQLTCKLSVTGRKRPMSFALLLDVNQSDGDQVGMTQVSTPECAANHKYDPFFKRCRQLACALPGRVIVDGKCVPSG